MSIFNQMSREEIRQHFTHYGLFCGLVPVYVGELGSSDGCLMSVRNWWPEWMFGAANALYSVAFAVMEMFNPDLEPGWPILLTGEIA